MKIYQMTDLGEAEAASPESNPSDAKRVLYFLRKRSNRTASDELIAQSVFDGDRARAGQAMRILNNPRVNAVRLVSGG